MLYHFCQGGGGDISGDCYKDDKKVKTTFKLTVLANKVQKMSTKPTKKDITAINGGWTLWPLSIEVPAKGGLQCQFYLLNGTGEAVKQINNLRLTVAAGSPDNVIAAQTYNKVTASASKGASKTLKFTFPASACPGLSGVFLPDEYANGTLFFDLNVNDVTLTSKKHSYFFIPTVFPTSTQFVNVEEIDLSDIDIDLEIGETHNLTAKVYPENATNQNLKWTSSNSSVATVSGGLVKAVAPGNATIMVDATDGSGVYAECNIDVIDPSAASDYKDFEFDDGVLTRYIGNGADVVIPEKDPNGVPVRTIGWSAFCDSTNIRTVSIPDSVTNIESSAFSNCSNLSSISIPDSVIQIGDGAFSECSNLISLDLNEGLVAIGSCAFRNCHTLKNIDIPNSVITLGSSAFEDCNNLVTVNIGNCVTMIDEYTFKNCLELVNVKLPDTIVSIESGAFYNCSNLAAINWPDSIVRIGNSAFEQCTRLSNVIFGSNIAGIGDYAFKNCDNLTNISVPDHVSSVGREAFASCDRLESVTLTDGIAEIGHSAFLDCVHLKTITMPDSVCILGENVFGGCSSLTSAVLSDSITYIEADLFSNCRSLRSVQLPHYITKIGSHAFADCISLPSIHIPSGVISIEWNAFKGCKSLTSVEIPYGVTSIDYGAFSGCSSLRNATLPETVQSIESNAFADTALGMTIHGTPGSLVEDYAKENEIMFKSISESESHSENVVFSVTHKDLVDSVLTMDAGACAENHDYSTLEITSNKAWTVVLTNNTANFLKFVEVEGSSATVDSETSANGAANANQKLRLMIKTTPKAGTTSKATLQFTVDGKSYSYTIQLTKPESTIQTPAVDVAVSNISLNKSSLSLNPGQSDILLATILPNNASNKSITWSSSNTNVATVSEGKVTAINEGEAKITVKTLDGNRMASCSVIVNKMIKECSLTLTSPTDDVSYVGFTGKGTIKNTINVSWNMDGDIEDTYLLVGLYPSNISETDKLYYFKKTTDHNTRTMTFDGQNLSFTSNNMNCCAEVRMYNSDNELIAQSYREIKVYASKADYLDYVENTHISELFEQDNSVLDNNLVNLSAILSYKAYDIDTCKKWLTEHGFRENDYIPNYYDSREQDTVGTLFGQRTYYNSDGVKSRVYVIALRGSTGWNEWASNFRIGDSGNHEGFELTYNHVLNAFGKYMKNIELEEPVDQDNSKVWITGHSRGGAIADLLAHYRVNGLFSSNNVYAYTFAAPSSIVTGNPGTKWVFNIYQEADIVPRVPWYENNFGFTRIGQDIKLPSFATINGKLLNNVATTNAVINNLASIATNREVYMALYNSIIECNDAIKQLDNYDAGVWFKAFLNAKPTKIVAVAGIIISHPISSIMTGIGGYHIYREFNDSEIKEWIDHISDTHDMTTYISEVKLVYPPDNWVK